jgi:hypothetical protein
MAEWLTQVLGMQFLIMPVVAWLWSIAKFPKMEWNKIALGTALTLAGTLITQMSISLSAYSAENWLVWIVSITSIVGNVAYTLGLGVIGLYALIGAIGMIKI